MYFLEAFYIQLFRSFPFKTVCYGNVSIPNTDIRLETDFVIFNAIISIKEYFFDE